MIRVLVSGICGRMGATVAKAVDEAADLVLVGGVDMKPGVTSYTCADGSLVPVENDLAKAIDELKPEVMVDFTRPTAVEGNIRIALPAGVNCVIGTTGLSDEKLEQLAGLATDGATLFVAPNFTTGAVLMMKFAQMAARYFPDAEVIEFHHDGKADAPSGTAIRTARLIAAARDEESKAPGRETELAGMEGARGALVDGVPVHSVREAGFSAHQEVIFGSSGQTLTIRHDSIDRTSYMPGVLLACREVPARSGLIIGLENLMVD